MRHLPMSDSPLQPYLSERKILIDVSKCLGQSFKYSSCNENVNIEFRRYMRDGIQMRRVRCRDKSQKERPIVVVQTQILPENWEHNPKIILPTLPAEQTATKVEPFSQRVSRYYYFYIVSIYIHCVLFASSDFEVLLKRK